MVRAVGVCSLTMRSALRRGRALISGRGDAVYSCGTTRALWLRSTRGLVRMAVHEEPNSGERGRTVADRMPIFSMSGAEAISSVVANVTNLAVPWFVLVTTGSPVMTGLTGAAMGRRP